MGVYFPFPWSGVGSFDRFNKLNRVEVMLSDFWSWIIKDGVAFAWLSFLGCLPLEPEEAQTGPCGETTWRGPRGGELRPLAYSLHQPPDKWVIKLLGDYRPQPLSLPTEAPDTSVETGHPMVPCLNSWHRELVIIINANKIWGNLICTHSN